MYGLSNKAKMIFVVVIFLAHKLSGADLKCFDKDKAMSINNDEVLRWKAGPTQVEEARVFVQGQIVKVDEDRNAHDRFVVQLGPNPGDTISFRFNHDFGQLGDLKAGDEIIACGDYAHEPGYKEPVIHWLHASLNGPHDHGFLVVNGVRHGGAVEIKPRKFHANEAVNLAEIQPKPQPDCFVTDNNGIIRNPNRNLKGKPYASAYGFLFDGTHVWIIKSADATTAAPGPKKESAAEFFRKDLKAEMHGDCPVQNQSMYKPSLEKIKRPLKQVMILSGICY